MCLVRTDKFEIAKRDFCVFKVVLKGIKNYHLLFKTLTGGDNIGYNKSSATGNPLLTKQTNIFNTHNRPATHFEYGKGYMSFLKLDNAIKYVKICKKKRKDMNITIIKIKVPKGSKFEKGKIDDGFIGSRLEAVRSEYIDCSKLKEIKRWE
jgi:hypothetical protein